ncbi:MAG: 3-oxoacid CoA-transferase subunit B, partial [Marivirga sp.]
KIITDLAVLEVQEGGGFLLLERAPGVSIEEIKAATSGKLTIPDNVEEMKID